MHIIDFWLLLFSYCQVKVGPESVGYQLVSKALCFGGDTCTATDVALSAGVAKGIIFMSLNVLL